MDIPQLDTTNILLGILAALAILQMMAAVAAILWIRSTVARVSRMATDVESRYLQPVVQETQRVLQQTRDVIAGLQPAITRANTIVSNVESGTRRAMLAVDTVNEQVDSIVHTGLQQVRAIERGLRRGVEALVAPSHR